jgi:hypothetical protein
MRAFAQQPDIHVAEHRWEAVRVVNNGTAAIVPPHVEAIGAAFSDAQAAFEKPIRMAQVELDQRAGVGRIDHRDLRRAGQQGSHPKRALLVRVHAEHRERIAVRGGPDELDLSVVDHDWRASRLSGDNRRSVQYLRGHIMSIPPDAACLHLAVCR